MISRTVEYGLRAAVYLASVGTTVTAAEISAATGAPAGYVPKILGELKRVGLVVARRGTGGGFALGRPADRVTVLDIVRALEPGFQRIRECPIGRHADISLCPLHRLIDRQIAAAEAAFAARTLQSLLDEGVGMCTPDTEHNPFQTRARTPEKNEKI